MNTYQAKNRDALVAFFEAGAKPTRTLGFELEHVIVQRGTQDVVPYEGAHGVREILERLKPSYRTAAYENGSIVALSRCRDNLTIEPAAQLEISAGPYETVGEVARGYAAFREALDPILDEFGLETPFYGYHPTRKASELKIVPKLRYECMTEFLGAQSYSALCMMRGTSSLQISVDYHDEADAMRKLRVAEKLTPILALVTDNSPFFEGAPVVGHLARTAVWAGMWQDRVGIIPGSLDPAFGFADYADYIMTRQAILVPDGADQSGFRKVGDQTFDEIYAESEMDDEELQHALSMVWPDARLKNFVEIRPADALPPELAYAYTALIKLLFYSDSCLEKLDDALADVDEESIAAAKRSLIGNAYEGAAFGKPAGYWADLLIELASGQADAEDAAYLEPLAQLVAARRCPKDDLSA